LRWQALITGAFGGVDLDVRDAKHGALVIDTPLIKERILLERIGFDDLVFANDRTDPRLPPAGGQGRNAHETVVSG
jgi:hypothetical protein